MLTQAVKDKPSLILLGETGSGRRGDFFACWSKPSRTTPASFCWEKLDQVGEGGERVETIVALVGWMDCLCSCVPTRVIKGDYLLVDFVKSIL